MNKPRCIRIFKTRDEARLAEKVLTKANIESYIKQDKFGKLTLPQLGMTARFRLYIDQKDIVKAAKHLAKLLRKKRLDE